MGGRQPGRSDLAAGVPRRVLRPGAGDAQDARRDHREALPLVFANGDYKNWFVPTEVRVTTRQVMRDDDLDGGELTLREYVPSRITWHAGLPRPEHEPALVSPLAIFNGLRGCPLGHLPASGCKNPASFSTSASSRFMPATTAWACLRYQRCLA